MPEINCSGTRSLCGVVSLPEELSNASADGTLGRTYPPSTHLHASVDHLPRLDCKGIQYNNNKGERDGRRGTHGDRKEEHTEEYSDRHTGTSGSNTHTEQHGTPLDGRGTGHNT